MFLVDAAQVKLENYKNDLKNFIREYHAYMFLAFIGGVIIHAGVMIYNIGNGDTVKWAVYQYDFTHERASGRWMLQYISMLRNYKVIPIFDTLIAIGCLSIAAIIIIDCLRIKSTIYRALFSIILLSSPFVNFYLYIYYTSDAYCLGFLLATIAAMLVINGKKWKSIILAAFIMMTSLAIYQAMINIFVLTCVICVFKNAFECEKPVKEQSKLLLRLFGCAIISIILYLISIKASFLIHGGQLMHYKGLDEMGRYTPELVIQMAKTYFRYLRLLYFVPNDSVSASFYYSKVFNGSVINIYICAIIIVACTYFFVRNIYPKGKAYVLWSVVCSIILLFGFGAVIFASSTFSFDSSSINSLISPQFCLLYGLCFALLDVMHTPHSREIWLRTCVAVCGILLCYNLILALNEAYYGNELAWKEQHSIAQRIVDRIEQTEGWHEGIRLAIIGGFTSQISNNYPNIYEEEIRCSNMPYMWEHQTQVGWNHYLNVYFGINYEMVSEDEMENIASKDEVKNRPSFPDKDSVFIHDGVMVVKLRDS